MRRTLWTVLLCLCLNAAAFALSVVGTYPAENSEDFATRDTLRIWFDAVPGSTVGLFIQGTNAAYPVAWRQVRGDTLLIVPQHFWMVGDRVTISVAGVGVNRYVFGFSIAVPNSSNLVNPEMGVLRYNHFPRAMAAVDVDGDGPVDLAILFTDRLGVARNIGVAPYFDQSTLTWSDGGHSPCDAARVLRAADLNGDAKPDLVTSDPVRNTLSIYPNLSGGGTIQFGAPISFNLAMNGPSDFKIADMNGDGRPDIIAVGRTFDPAVSRLIVLVNRGNFTLDQSQWDIGLDPSMFDVADFNLDGRLDVVVSCRGDKSIEMLQNTSLNPLDFARRVVMDSLPAGPDGIIADNLYPCWDNSGVAQRPDLLVWSRGVHLRMQRGQQRTLDDDPFINRYCGVSDSSFSPAVLLIPPGIPLNITLGAFDAITGHPDKDWVVIAQRQAGDTIVQLYDDQLNAEGDIGTVSGPYSSLLFDADLDGDLDFFFIAYGSSSAGDESIVYYYSPPTQQHPTLDFGVVPIIGLTRTATYTYSNNGSYPLTITGVDIPFTDNVFSFSSPAFPETLQPGSSILLTYGFTPLDSTWYGPRESRIHYAGGDGRAGDTLMLAGIGGRSVIESVPYSGSATTFVVDFGTVEPSAVDTVGFHMANAGNYPLQVAYDRSALSRFTLLGSPVDTVAAHSVSGDSCRVRFSAPAAEGEYRECLIVYDSTFFQSDGFGARNRLVRDTIQYCFRAQVIHNSPPQFRFPDVSPFEGSAGAFEIHVFDPNSLPGQDSLRVEYFGISPPGHLLITEPNSFTETWVDSTFAIAYHVNHNVPPSGENCTLMFRAWDYQFPERWVDTTWAVHINDVDDPPHIQPRDTVLNVNEGELLVATLQVFDEEHDALVVQSLGLPASAQDTFLVSQELYRLTWQTGYSDAGNYTVTVTVHERDHPALADTAHIEIVVHDMAPDLMASELRVDPSVVDRGTAVLIHYTFHEQLGIPVPTPFAVVLKDSLAGLASVLLRRDYPSLPAGATISESYNYFLQTCGGHYFILQIMPYGPDRDATDNTRYAAVPVTCPDAVADPIVSPVSVHKNEQFSIQVAVEERNGVALDTEFTAVLRVYAAGTMRHIAVIPFHSLAAHGRVVQTIQWASDTCNEHRFEWEVMPPSGWDANADDDMSQRSLTVLCDPFRVYPLPFTPNGDGYNDTLYFAFGDNRYQSPVVNIFSLDGRLVATERTVQTHAVIWLGRDRYGKDCAPGAYLYVFEDGDRRVSSGIVYVAR